jgi:hypothetical protein
MRAAADLVGLVRLEAVQRKLVFFGEDPDRLQPKLVGGAEDADGDLGPVRDKDFSDVRQSAPFERNRVSLARHVALQQDNPPFITYEGGRAAEDASPGLNG